MIIHRTAADTKEDTDVADLGIRVNEKMATFLKHAITLMPRSCQSSSNVVEKSFFDYGFRYKVVIRNHRIVDLHGSPTNEVSERHQQRTTIDIGVSLPNNDFYKLVLQDRSMIEHCLGEEFGHMSVISMNAELSTNESTMVGFDFVIRISNETLSKFSSIDECVLSLAQIRINLAGAPLASALEGLLEGRDDAEEGDRIHDLIVHPKWGKCQWLGSSEKVMVIFTVTAKDYLEKALTSVLLQQFPGSQKRVYQSPHCEFRRHSDPPHELLLRENTQRSRSDHSATTDCIGFLSLTFFPSHVKTIERRKRAVAAIVNFFPNLDKNLKKIKINMDARMHNQGPLLLCPLSCEPQPSELRPQHRRSNYCLAGDGVIMA